MSWYFFSIASPLWVILSLFILPAHTQSQTAFPRVLPLAVRSPYLHSWEPATSTRHTPTEWPVTWFTPSVSFCTMRPLSSSSSRSPTTVTNPRMVGIHHRGWGILRVVGRRHRKCTACQLDVDNFHSNAHNSELLGRSYVR